MGGTPGRGDYAGRRVRIVWQPVEEEKRSVHLVLYGFIPSAGGKVLWHVDLEIARDWRTTEYIQYCLDRLRASLSSSDIVGLELRIRSTDTDIKKHTDTYDY